MSSGRMRVVGFSVRHHAHTAQGVLLGEAGDKPGTGQQQRRTFSQWATCSRPADSSYLLSCSFSWGQSKRRWVPNYFSSCKLLLFVSTLLSLLTWGGRGREGIWPRGPLAIPKSSCFTHWPLRLLCPQPGMPTARALCTSCNSINLSGASSNVNSSRMPFLDCKECWWCPSVCF